MLLSELLTADRVRVPPRGASKDDILRELVELAVPAVCAATVEPILSAVRDREHEVSTGIGGGVALPQGRTPLMDELVMTAGVAAVRSAPFRESLRRVRSGDEFVRVLRESEAA